MNSKSSSVMESKSSAAAIGRTGQLVGVRIRSHPGRVEATLMSLVFFGVGFLGLSIGLMIIALYRSDSVPSAQSQISCQSLIDQALSYSGKYCNQIGANKGCYGNTTI